MKNKEDSSRSEAPYVIRIIWMTVTTIQNEAPLYQWSVIIFLHNPTVRWCACLILARFLQLSWQKLGSWILLAVELVTSKVLCHWPKNNSPMGKVSTKSWIFLQFPECSNSVFVVHCVGIVVLKDRTVRHMFMPLPANSLMQSARLVTAYVHMRTPAAQHTDATAFKHTGTLYILWLSMKMDVYTALKLILSKMVSPCFTSPQIQGTHLLKYKRGTTSKYLSTKLAYSFRITKNIARFTLLTY